VNFCFFLASYDDGDKQEGLGGFFNFFLFVSSGDCFYLWSSGEVTLYSLLCLLEHNLSCRSTSTVGSSEGQRKQCTRVWKVSLLCASTTARYLLRYSLVPKVLAPWLVP